MRRFLLEVSWEVANKVGGIYTVIKEKSPYIHQRFGDDYLVIGPFLSEKSLSEFTLLTPPAEFNDVITAVEKYGIKAHYGEWLVSSTIRGFLLDFSELQQREKLNLMKYELWERYRIDSRRTGQDFDEPLAWCRAVSFFLKEFGHKFEATVKILHLHEWLSGSVILFEELPTFKKIFSIHATVLGRSLAAAQINFWEHLSLINPETEAYRLGVEAKHAIEMHTAKKADYFTCVSNLLALEAEKFLGKKADAVLPNGLNFNRFPTVEEISYAHRLHKKTIQDFILYYFAPFYKVETKDSLFYFISGRHEVKNKGIDIFIRALGLLKRKLQQSKTNIFAFIFVPTETKEVNHLLLNNLNIYRNIEEKIDELSHEIKSRLVHFLIHKETISPETLFTQEEFLEIQSVFKQARPLSEIPITTHFIDPNDEILNLIRQENLLNKEGDRVKVIYYPTYLSHADGLLNLSYEEAISGCHLGVFPSFYEPWGYTPLETAASGVITITTDLTGFADYLKNNAAFDSQSPGIHILKRKLRRETEVIEDLAEIMFKFSEQSRSERVQEKLEARRLALLCDWNKLIKHYFDLYDQILKDAD